MKIRIADHKFKSWRWFQYQLIEKFKNTRFLSLVVHRQSGKTSFGVWLLVDFIFFFDKRRNPECTVILSTSTQAFNVYFRRVHDIIRVLPEKLYKVQKSPTGVTVVTLKRPWIGDWVTVTFAGSGNIEALRGWTNDLVIIDEAASLPSKVWYDVMKDTLDDTGGKALITSTQKGRTWFYKMQKAFEQMRKDGDMWVDSVNYDNVNSMLRSKEHNAQKERLAKATGEWVAYLREQKNNPDAVDLEESPFALAIIEKRSQPSYSISDPRLYGCVNVVVDVGKPDNNAAWMFVHGRDKLPIFIEYQDKFNQRDLVDYIWKKYKGVQINIVYPNDVKQTSIMDGVPRIKLIRDHMARYRNMGSRILTKRSSSKKEFLLRAVEIFNHSKVDLVKCAEGMDKLSGARLKKDLKTEYVSYGDMVKNGNQHAVDSMGYVAAAIDNGYTLEIKRVFNQNDPISIKNLKYGTKSPFKY